MPGPSEIIWRYYEDVPFEEDYCVELPERLKHLDASPRFETTPRIVSEMSFRRKKKTLEGDVLVVGAGITGMQAAIDIADKGFRVIVIDKSSTIGGNMVKLDKTFPTNDCSICTCAPKMVEVARHPNITLITYAELAKLDGAVGNFTAHIFRKSKYVDPSRCTGCGDCAAVCPVEVINPFDEKLSKRKAIYIEFPQAVPIVYTIDYEHCTGCGSCERVCEPKAISFLEKSEDIEVHIGSVVVATGFELFEPLEMRREYGYGKYPNVISAMQYERLLSSFGPTEGKILRPSDGAKPKSIAWIQCVGSRSKQLGFPYCSRVCCMYATKEASITKEADPSTDVTIFYMDMRAFGKDFQQYYENAKKLGVNFIRARPSSVYQNPDKSLTVRYLDTHTRELREKTVDLLVLSTAIVPSKDNRKLARILEIEVDESGFFRSADILSNPTQSTREGVFLAGCNQGPKDIPDSVSMGSGAAARAIVPIVRRKRAARPELPPERDVVGEPPRIGVFICHCGKNIAGYLDVAAVTEYARTLPNVVFADHDMFVCSQDVQKKIKEKINEMALNRIVVAACSPRTHGPLFQETLVQAGLNKYLFEMANIRNHCSWVHSHEPDKATEKAKDLVRIAVTKAAMLEPLQERSVPVTPRILVIGGGLSGMRAALALAEMGIESIILEKNKELGGNLNDLHSLFPMDIKASDIIEPLKVRVGKERLITVLTESELLDVEGFIGNFKARVRTPMGEKVLEFGTAIIATGFKEIDLEGRYSYGKSPKIITQLQLERMLKEENVPKVKSVVVINCAGSMDELRPYCCRIGCGVAIKNAKLLSQHNPGAEITLLYRDIRVFGKEEEEYYADVIEKYGVKIIRYLPEMGPEVEVDARGNVKVKVVDAVYGDEYILPADLVVLTAETEGNVATEQIKQFFKVPAGLGNFFTEAHAKIRPLDFSSDGVYICGSAHYPKNLADTIAQAEGAASRAAIPIMQGEIRLSGNVSYVDATKCDGCAYCVDPCPFKGITLKEITRDGQTKKIVEVNEAICKGCGVCMATCPKQGVYVKGFTYNQIMAQAKAAIERCVEPPPEVFEPRIVAFCCNWCSYAGADLAGVSRLQYPPNVRIIRVMCSGMIHPNFVIETLTSGADGVIICGCHPGDCHYLDGNKKAAQRAEAIKLMLQDLGIEEGRFRLEWISASEGQRFAEVMREMVQQVKELGPNPYRK
ncbi:MAG: hydrogenase iron-sulfur subunit [Thermoplasmata archaeon]